MSESGSGVTIRTRSGSVEAERVLVAAGGHTQSLLGRSLGFTVYGRTAALFRLGAAEVQRLAGMPSMRCLGPKGDNPYILPPIRYPDGQTWLKLGGDPVDLPLGSEADIKDWFRSGGSIEVADRLQGQILERIRDLAFEERRVVPCMTTFGDSGLPCIGPLQSASRSRSAATARAQNVRTNWAGSAAWRCSARSEPSSRRDGVLCGVCVRTFLGTQDGFASG
ncbi:MULTISPECIES: hypothetical protein [Bradyrhizobium]|uniref:hypothetical protein n=1 Tax=Bradyrhizobium TaxID=374 RepID=UPI0035C76C0D